MNFDLQEANHNAAGFILGAENDDRAKTPGRFWQQIAGSNDPSAALTGTTAETLFAEAFIPAAMAMPGARVRLTGFFSWVGLAGNKTYRMKIGGAGTGGLAFGQGSHNSNSGIQVVYEFWVNAAGQQVSANSNGGIGSIAGAIETRNEDMTTPTRVAITGQLAVATDSMTLLAWALEVLPA